MIGGEFPSASAFAQRRMQWEDVIQRTGTVASHHGAGIYLIRANRLNAAVSTIEKVKIHGAARLRFVVMRFDADPFGGRIAQGNRLFLWTQARPPPGCVYNRAGCDVMATIQQDVHRLAMSNLQRRAVVVTRDSSTLCCAPKSMVHQHARNACRGGRNRGGGARPVNKEPRSVNVFGIGEQ